MTRIPMTALALSLASAAAAQDTFISGVTISDSDVGEADLFVSDVSVLDGETCIGNGCDSAETFGSDVTLKLRDATPSITFVDTSDPPFPDREWKLLVNDPDSGGLERFSIKDGETGNIPFTVQGFAPENSLWVGYTGHIGVGTSLPQSDIHIVSGSGPSIRLEQDGTQGAAQTFEMYVAAGGFVIHDDLAGTFPFRVNAGAPTYAMAITDSGNIGIGTGSPNAPLELRQPGTFNFFRITAEDAAVNESVDIVFTEGPLGTGELRYNIVEFGQNPQVPEMTLDADGNMTLTGALTTGGPTCSGGCDAVFIEEQIIPESDYAARMWADGHLPHVGPTAPGEAFNVTEKMGGMLNALEHAHIYIERQNTRIAQQDTRIATQDAQIAALLARLGALEGALK